VKNRLERGRARLRARLVRRGLGPAAVLPPGAWPAAGSACVPTLLGVVTGKVASSVMAAAGGGRRFGRRSAAPSGRSAQDHAVYETSSDLRGVVRAAVFGRRSVSWPSAGSPTDTGGGAGGNRPAGAPAPLGATGSEPGAPEILWKCLEAAGGVKDRKQKVRIFISSPGAAKAGNGRVGLETLQRAFQEGNVLPTMTITTFTYG